MNQTARPPQNGWPPRNCPHPMPAKKKLPVAPVVEASVPTQQMSIIHLQSLPPVQTQDMSTDRLHSILRASEAGQWEDYLALVRDVTCGDAAIASDWMQRKTRLLGKPWGLTNGVKDDAEGEKNRLLIEENLKGCGGMLDACTHLLDSTLFPVAVVEKIYARSGSGWRLKDLVPVPHDLLDYTSGRLRIKETSPEGVPTGRFLDMDPMRYLVHRGHLLRSLPDCWGGPARALLFWWFLAAAGRNWWSRGLERDSAPFLVGKYDTARPEDRYALVQAFQDAVQRFGLVLSRDTDVQVFKDLASGSAEAHEKFQLFCQGMCSRVVVGQTLTTGGKASGLGNAQADVQDDVLTNIVAFDDLLLAETLQEQLFRPLLALNGRGGPVPLISRGVTSDNLMEKATVLKELAAAGVKLLPEAAAALSDSLGLPVTISEAAPVLPPGAAIPPPVATLRAPVAPGDANELLAGNAAAKLSQAFRGSLAPIRRLVDESTSAEDLETRLAAFYSDWSPGRVAALTAEALTAFAANGTQAAPA